ncbi:MAG TPA: hypothetical protein VKB09_08400, partial [Thermomicrobiales bacterium]|nr:hypothetical protein [Thermomicrobiales bacterium]
YVESTDGEPIASFVVDEHGDFAGRIVIPDVETGNLLIAAKGETSGTKASRSFRVTRPRAERSTGSGEEPAADAGGDQGSTSDGADQPAPDAAPTAEPEPTEEAAPAEEPTPTEEPNPEPTPEPVPHDLVFLPVADTSVSAANPDAAQAPEEMGSLAAAGPDGDVAFITFQLEGIAGGTVVSAQLVLTDTGETGGATDTIGVLRDVWADESGWTYASAPVAGGAAAIAADGSAASAWLDPGVETAVDVTGTVGADGTITFVISGTSDATLLLGSRESGASPRLVVTVLDTGSGS